MPPFSAGDVVGPARLAAIMAGRGWLPVLVVEVSREGLLLAESGHLLADPRPQFRQSRNFLGLSVR